MKPVRRVALLAFTLLLTLIPASPGVADNHEALVIAGVVDGPLSGGVPKAVEFRALTDIADLSVYGFGSANNAGGTNGEEYTFPAVPLGLGEVFYVASESAGFTSFFCEAPDATSSAANINGDDSIELFANGTVSDVFGVVGVDGSGEPWEYADGWSKRFEGTGPDGTTFQLSNWDFSGVGALNGETRNDLATTPYPYEGNPDCGDDNGGGDGESSLVLSGVIDGPLTGGVPKAIELTVLVDIPDLSIYGVGAANNGGGTDGIEFTFPPDTASAGDVFYVASESDGFVDFFCAEPEYTSSVANINGDDAIELFLDGTVVDVFGEIAVDGSGQAWEYLDGWAKRVDGTGPDGSTFTIEDWTFSGPNALDGETQNQGAQTPYDFEGDADCADPDPEFRFIHEIQGAGATSPLDGDRVIIEGVVVSDVETFGEYAGFFVQEEDADMDGDPTTSEGIFVFNFDNDSVNVGDLVRVEGTVDERAGNSFDTVTNTQLTDFVEITVVSSDNPLPTAAWVTFPLSDPGALEQYEGMRAEFDQTLVISEYFNFDRFNEVVLALPWENLPGISETADRLYQPTAVYDPYSDNANALFDYNARARITLDDTRTTSNPDPLIHPGNGDVFDLDNRFRGGDTITGIKGAIYHSFNVYRILPTEYGAYAAIGERPDAPDVGGNLQVAAFNTLNYFLTIDDGSNDICGPARNFECRGADDAEEQQRQRAKLIAALVGLDADVVGLIEIENTPGVEVLRDVVDGLNGQLGDGTYDYIDAGDNEVVGTDAIKVGIIYRPASVTPYGDTAVLDSSSFLDPNNTGTPKNRAAVGQTFVENSTGEVFSVVVNHLKSKGSRCGDGDDDAQAGSCNLTRTLAAQRLVDWIDGDPTGIDDDDWLIVGDLNAYDEEDPIDALAAAGYVDLEQRFDGELAYSYVFDGQWGYLDYALASPSLSTQVTDATAWHINSPEPDIFDYDTSFKLPAQDALYEPDAYRSSDHDPVLVGLTLNAASGLELVATPETLFPPNHKLVDIELTVNVGGAVMVTDVVSSEADSGLDREDVPNDIVIVDDDSLRLRAERFSEGGRTYTITAVLSSDGQVLVGAEDTVVVPQSRRGGR